MVSDYFTLPRIYVDRDCAVDMAVPLSRDQAHYFKTVLRRQEEDLCRVFNGHDGEYLGVLRGLTKKTGEIYLTQHLRPQPEQTRRVHLLCPPIKKNRMDILIEKAVELGVTDIHPVLTRRTDIRKINVERLKAQIMEAAEQCERFTIPILHEMEKLEDKLSRWTQTKTIHWCFERSEAEPFEMNAVGDFALLVGPVGGFAPEEVTYLSAHKLCQTLSLGDTVYRVETAALVVLSKIL